MLRKQCRRNQSRTPQSGDPPTGEPGAGKSCAGKSQPGKPCAGDPPTGKQISGKAFPGQPGIIREITVHTKDLTRLVRRSVHMGTTIITITTISYSTPSSCPCSAGGSRQPGLFYPEPDLCPEYGQPGACGKIGIQK